MVSKASDDLPEPDRPVTTTSLSRGISTSMFLRLCSRAPLTTILFIAWVTGSGRGRLRFWAFMRDSGSKAAVWPSNLITGERLLVLTLGEKGVAAVIVPVDRAATSPT